MIETRSTTVTSGNSYSASETPSCGREQVDALA